MNDPIIIVGVGLRCYDCGHDDSGEDCTMEKSGKEVRCQMNDAKQDYYGDNCYVGHTGSYYTFKFIHFK